MLEKMTLKEIKSLSNGTVFYTDLDASGINCLDKIGYYANAYGWQFDVYDYGETVLVIGYAPSFATYIEPHKFSQSVCKILQEKIEYLEFRKKQIMKENNF